MIETLEELKKKYKHQLYTNEFENGYNHFMCFPNNGRIVRIRERVIIYVIDVYEYMWHPSECKKGSDCKGHDNMQHFRLKTIINNRILFMEYGYIQTRIYKL